MTRLRLRVLRAVRSDVPFSAGHASSGVYEGDDVEMNPYGAVAVMTPSGWLGLKPAEFEWLDTASLLEQARRAGCAPLAAVVRRLAVDIVEAGRVSERLDDGWHGVGAVTLNGTPEDLADLPIGPAVLEVRS